VRSGIVICHTVWEKTQAVLAYPDIILTQLAQTNSPSNLDALETEIREIRANLRNYEQRRSNLLQAMELGEFEKDEILDRLNNLKRLRHTDEARLSDLLKTRDNITNLTEAKIKLGQLYERVLQNLRQATLDIKRLAFDALDIRVYASHDTIEIRGVIPLELALPTTAQTSGCLISWTYEWPSGKEAVRIVPNSN